MNKPRTRHEGTTVNAAAGTPGLVPACVVALVSAALPAWRASRVEPIEALRFEWPRAARGDSPGR